MTEFLRDLPPEVAVVLAASMPVLEVRGAIPLGVFVFNMGLGKVALLALIGNLLPVPLLLIALSPLSRLSQRWSPTRKFFAWLYARAQRKGLQIVKLKTLGVFLFVAIPVPGTGAWMGSVVAQVLGLPFWRAFMAISTGVVFATLFVSLASALGVSAVLGMFLVLFVASYILQRL